MSALLWYIAGAAGVALVAFFGGYGLGRRQDAQLIGEMQAERDALRKEAVGLRRIVRRAAAADPTLDELRRTAEAAARGA